MPFTVSDFAEFKQLLLEHPEWQVELRRLLLSDDFEALTQIVRELAEAQRRAEQRLSGVEERLAKAEDRLAGVEDRLAKAEDRLAKAEDRLAGVEDRLARLEAVVTELAEAQRRSELRLHDVDIRLGRIEGRTLEIDYREKASGYFARWLRRIRVVNREDLAEQLEDRLKPELYQDALLIDVLVRGRIPDRGEAYLAVEVSAVVDEADVARAARRAELFRRVGLPAVPAAAGRHVTHEANLEAASLGVLLVQDGGQGTYWDEALAKWPVG